MAGGIDWFRWHHGSVTDPKFQLVARRSGASLPDVLAVWAYLLEKASAAEFRGCFGDIDCEAVDCLFGFDDGTTNAILTQMVDRSLIADEFVVAWEKRQPKREDETAADRKRRQREREHELAVTEAMSRNVTQCHADVTHGHDREEKSREEERREESKASAPPVPAAPARSPKRASALPADFEPNENAHSLAASLALDLTAELAKFRDYYAMTGKTGKDWQAGFRNWLTKAAEFRGKQPQARASPIANREESRRAAGIGIFGNLEDEHGRRTFDITPAATFALGGPDFP
jgi:hypothetical protein